MRYKDTLKYMFEGVDYDNKTYVMQMEANHAGALELYKKAMKIKEEMFGPCDYRLCVSLGGLADTYLSLKDYNNAMFNAQRMKQIAEWNHASEQIRIANEIIDDIHKVNEIF